MRQSNPETLLTDETRPPLWCDAPASRLKQKSRRNQRRDFITKERSLRRRFAERFDALGAQRLLHEAALFHHRDLLEVGFEGAVGGAL